MSKEDFYDLGKDPKRIGPDEKKYYPTLPISLDAIKGMKVGQDGTAEIRFQVNGSGVEVRAIKFLGGSTQKEDVKNGGKQKAGPEAAGTSKD